MGTFALLVLAYIVQILLTLAYPYYKYRQDYKEHKDRTIGGFSEFVSHRMGDMFLFLAFFPFFGLGIIVLILIVGLIVIGLENFYNKYIKNIKI